MSIKHLRMWCLYCGGVSDYSSVLSILNVLDGCMVKQHLAYAGID